MTASTVHLAVYDTLSDWEVGYVTAAINGQHWKHDPGRFRVVTVGATREPVTTMGGLRIVPDVALDELSPADSAMLILPGADTWDTGGNAAFARKARELLDAGVPVAAICGATAGLAAEGLLDDRDHTSNAAEYLRYTDYAGGPRYRNDLVVTDGDLITANATAPVEFAREVLQWLDVYEPAVLDAWDKLYGRQDPAGFYELMAATAAPA
jgi:putative intracellular protease/amidase